MRSGSLGLGDRGLRIKARGGFICGLAGRPGSKPQKTWPFTYKSSYGWYTGRLWVPGLPRLVSGHAWNPPSPEPSRTPVNLCTLSLVLLWLREDDRNVEVSTDEKLQHVESRHRAAELWAKP